MPKYIIVFEDEVQDELYDSYEDAALYMCSCADLGKEILNMSNPWEYDYDEEEYEFYVEEVNE